MNKYHKIIAITDEQLTFLQSRETGSPLFRQFDIKNLSFEAAAKKLMLLIKEFKLKQTGVAVVIHRQNAIMRSVTLPSADIQELKKMVALQMGSIVPYAPDDVVFDLQILKEMGGGSSKVLIVIVPKAIILRCWDIYTKAGIRPSMITLSTFGLWSWYRNQTGDRSTVVMILDIDIHIGEICICTGDHVYASRAIRFPNQDIAVDDFKFLFKEIDITVDGYLQERIGPLPSKIIITGSGLVLLDLMTVLGKEYELPVENADISKSVKNATGSVAALIGLSSADLGRTINLVPDEFIRSYLKAQAVGAFKRMSMAVIILMMLVAGTFAMHLYRKNVYLEDLDRQWVQTKKQLDVMEKTKAKIDAMTAALNKRVIFKDIFTVISRSAAPGISLYNMNISDDRMLTMQGVAKDQADINAFQESLIRSSVFANVRLDFVNKRTTQDSEASYFKLSCQLK